MQLSEPEVGRTLVFESEPKRARNPGQTSVAMRGEKPKGTERS